ncbi:MAG: ChaN family lipoprotein [Nitrospira sp.]
MERFVKNVPAVRTALCVCVGLLLSACVVGQHGLTATDLQSRWQPGRIIEVQSGKVLDLPVFLAQLTRYDILYLGEEHYNQHHIDAALAVIEAAIEFKRPVTLTMEMFGWDGQAALNDYLSTPAPNREEFLDRANWKQNWGGAFANYEPLVQAARIYRLPLRAMNPPKSLIRQVVKLGLADARTGPDWATWGMDQEDIVDDQAYRSRILDQLKRCHGGGTDDDYLRMYEASMVRDEGMAKTVADAFHDIQRRGTSPRSLLLSYTGGGHIQYNLPVPQRVARRLGTDATQMTVYLTSFDQSRLAEVQDLLRDTIADYIWLTPISQQGPPQRCR